MQVDGGHRQKFIDFSDVTFKLAAWWLYWIFWFPDSIFSLALDINFKLQRHKTYVFGLEPIDFQQRHFQNVRLVAILDFSVSGLCRWHGFRSISQVCFWISTPNISGKILIYMGKSLYWFSVTSFSKWLPGGHIRFFGFWMAWFQQRSSNLLWNFSL